MAASDRAVELALAAAQAAADKLAQDILLLDVSEQLVITDVFLLASAPNDRQVKAVVDEIEERLRKHEEERIYYALERLWKDCPVIPFEDADRARAAERATGS